MVARRPSPYGSQVSKSKPHERFSTLRTQCSCRAASRSSRSYRCTYDGALFYIFFLCFFFFSFFFDRRRNILLAEKTDVLAKSVLGREVGSPSFPQAHGIARRRRQLPTEISLRQRCLAERIHCRTSKPLEIITCGYCTVAVLT